MPDQAALTRVWRAGWFSWWAELWLLDDRPPHFSILLDPEEPLPVDGYKRDESSFHMTRFFARRSARRMLARHNAGLHPKYDRPETEVSYG